MHLDENKVMELCRMTIDEARKSVAEDDRSHPYVGAILVGADGKVLVTAHRGERPKRHAEYCLLEKAQEQGIDTSVCTLFVTLEPCIKRGPKKIPCAIRVGMAGIKKVYIGTLDPDPGITGRGEMYLIYEGVSVEHFPPKFADELKELNKHFFDRFRAAHFWDPPPQSLYNYVNQTVISPKPLLAKSREGLLYQTLDLMLTDQSSIWITAGNLSWFRELQIAFLAASLDGRNVRVLHQVEDYSQDVSKIATCLGADTAKLAISNPLRFTIVGPRTNQAAAVCLDRSNSTLLRVPEDEGFIQILIEWFENTWNGMDPISGRPVSIQRIEQEDAVTALKKYVPQYRNCQISVEEISIDSTKPATYVLEAFKLFRLSQFIALKERHGLPDLARIKGSPWPLISFPVIERLPDGQMIIIDGTHRTYSARARGAASIKAFVVENPNFDLPSHPPQGWEHIEILPNKVPREKRYRNFDKKLFRPIRKAFESLALFE